MIRQLSIFLENRPGQLLVPCRLLGDAGIDILDLSLADTERFGILRLIVEDWQRAQAVLEAAGQVVKVTELLALEVPDQPGGWPACSRSSGRPAWPSSTSTPSRSAPGARAPCCWRGSRSPPPPPSGSSRTGSGWSRPTSCWRGRGGSDRRPGGR